MYVQCVARDGRHIHAQMYLASLGTRSNAPNGNGYLGCLHDQTCVLKIGWRYEYIQVVNVVKSEVLRSQVPSLTNVEHDYPFTVLAFSVDPKFSRPRDVNALDSDHVWQDTLA